jgi:hypothetical protein
MNKENAMDRRTVLGFLVVVPFLHVPVLASTESDWVIVGSRRLNPNKRTVSFALKNEVADLKQLAVEVRGNSLWLYDFGVSYDHGNSKTHGVNLNIPPPSGGCSPKFNLLQIGEHPKEVTLNFEYLPLTNKPTEIILWGSR